MSCSVRGACVPAVLSNLHSLSPLGHLMELLHLYTYCRACSRFCAWKPTHHLQESMNRLNSQRMVPVLCVSLLRLVRVQFDVWMLGYYKSTVCREFEASCSHECTNSYKGLSLTPKHPATIYPRCGPSRSLARRLSRERPAARAAGRGQGAGGMGTGRSTLLALPLRPAWPSAGGRPGSLAGPLPGRLAVAGPGHRQGAATGSGHRSAVPGACLPGWTFAWDSAHGSSGGLLGEGGVDARLAATPRSPLPRRWGDDSRGSLPRRLDHNYSILVCNPPLRTPAKQRHTD